MACTLEFYYDYGSPYSYLADTQAEAVAAEIDGLFARYHPAIYKAMWVDVVI
jgi:2-hydroxychromene-2-carboxylate isomerase